MLQDLKNQIDFFIRNKTKFSKKNYIEKDSKALEINLAQNMYFCELLERYFFKVSNKKINILDIGCKNWFYAKGEHDFFRSFSSDFVLDGVELDAYRLYSNFYSRYEVAKYYIKDLSNVNYIAGNLLEINQKYDYITWFLPFVSFEPHKFWGLPKKYFYPEKLLAHAYFLLNDNGQMLIVNQGEKERDIQKKMLLELGIYFEFLGEIKNDFFKYKNIRYGFLIKKV